VTNIEAQNLIGRRVKVSLGADGIYVGELLELQGDTTWRGRVRITGVVSPARHFEHGAVCRRGHRPGEYVDASQGTVSAAHEAGYGSYLGAVSAQLNQFVGSHSGYQTSQSPWVGEAFGRALGAVLIAETRRVLTGQWKLSLDETAGTQARLAH
jgi:hypothetical protein